MTTQTLKELIEFEYERSETWAGFKDQVFRLVDLYESDKPIIPSSNFVIDYGIPDEVPYGDICSCNPKNGGSGICGCVMGNKMVKNPKKYGYPTTNITTKTTIDL